MATTPAKKAAAPSRDPRGSGTQAAPAQTVNPNLPPDAPKGDEAEQPRARKRITEEKVSVTVHTPFKLTLDDSTVVQYHAGVQDIPKSHAEHWFSKHHLEANE